MKALVYMGPESLSYHDVADPVAGEGTELIRIEAVGICGSDMHAYLGHDARRPPPLILGHEIAGIITGGPRDGTRVTVNPLVPCGTCPACMSGRENICPERQIISMPPREGGFAEWLSMPAANLVEVPDGISPRKAALAEPIACSWHAVRLGLEALGDTGGADKALAIGGGAIGLGAALSLKAQGVRNVTIVESNPIRRAYLQDGCGQTVVSPDALETDGQFDLVVDGVGFAATREIASAQARPGGVIAHIGLGEGTGGLDIRRMTLQEITFIGTYTYTTEDFRETAEAIYDGSLGPLDWIETRALSDGAAAFRAIRAGEVAAPKIILEP